jgi:flagellar biosynthesis/type III secretory pathway M-ring protein FliF/YscJ
MKKIVLAAIGVVVLAASSCSKAPECTTEMITQKTQELTKVTQEAVTKDPAKATEIMTKAQEFATKYEGKTDAEACKAIDELIASIKG